MGNKLKQWLKQSKFESLDQEAALNIFVTAYFLRSKHEEVMSRYGLTMPQYNVLRILKGAYPKGYPRCDIINRMIEPAPDVTRLIDRLIKDDLVERFNFESDKRLSMTRISKKGLALLDNSQSEIESLNSFISSKLNKNEKIELSSLLEKIYGDFIK